MPRTVARKTNRGKHDISVYEQAHDEINNENSSIRAAAMKYDLCHVSLSRYLKKRSNNSNTTITMGYRAWNKVFTDIEEKKIAEYIIKAAGIYYGFSPKEIRRFAYELAVKYKKRMPPQWTKNEIAGEDWFSNYMKRHSELSIRCAQPTSIARATSFNVNNVNVYLHCYSKRNSASWSIDFS